MANWLSSRLKAAEQLLQQIDQQAAATLQKDRGGQKDGNETIAGKRPLSSFSASDEVGGFRGRDKATDRPPQSSISGGRKSQSPFQIKSRISPSSSQGKLSAEAAGEDWSELLGSAELAGNSYNRVSGSRGGEGDFYSGAVKSSRAKSKSGSRTHSRRNSSADLDFLTPLKTSQGASPVKDPTELSPASLEKGVVSRESQDLGSFRKFADEKASDEVRGSPSVSGLRDQDSATSSQAISVGNGEADGAKNWPDARRQTEAKEAALISLPGDELGINSSALESQNSSQGAGVNSVLYVGNTESVGTLAAAKSSVGNEEHNENVSTMGTPTISTEDGRDDSINVEITGSSQVDRANNDEDDGQKESQDDSVESWSNSADEDSSESGTAGTSDSEDSDYDERRRARKLALRKKLAKRRAMEAKAAAEEAARMAIKKREDLVERLLREKASLEALLAEGEEQHVKMAAELQQSMMEVVELLEQEKQLHNNSRRQGLESEVKLEAENANLAKTLAASQWELEEVSSKVSNARNLVEAKVDACSDLERQVGSLRAKLARPRRSNSARDCAYELESLEEEKSKILAGVDQLQLQAKEHKDNLTRFLDRQATPSSIQLELESQLSQVTDSLIRKQAQVEDLSTEKATLMFRIEAVSNSLREEQMAFSSRAPKRNPKGAWHELSGYDDDLEHGFGKMYSAKDKALDSDDYRHDHLNLPSHLRPFLRLVRQVDGLVMGAALVLRRNGMARVLAGLYILALHWWVILLIFARPSVTSSEDARSSVSTLVRAQSLSNQSTLSFL